MRIRPGYLVRVNGHRADDEYPVAAEQGHEGLVVDSDVYDVGTLEHPFLIVCVEHGVVSYRDGFWPEELEIVCDGKRHAHRAP